MTAYFRVKNFETFQHYRDRNPVWIKLYNSLLEDYEYASLPDASKAHLIAIWLLASRSKNKLPFDTPWIAGRIGATETPDLEGLCEAGFIELLEEEKPKKSKATNSRIKLLAEPEQSAIPEREGYREEGETDVVAVSAPAPSEFVTVGSKVLDLMGVSDDPRWQGNFSLVSAWLKEGFTPEQDIYPAVLRGMAQLRAKGEGPPKSLKYFTPIMQQAQHERLTELPAFLDRRPQSGKRPDDGIIGIAQRLKQQMDDEDAVRR